MRRLVFLLILTCGLAAAQAVTPPAAPSVVTLAGVVRSDGLPVPGATVTASQGTKTLTAVTGLDGEYSFPDAGAGAWTIQVEMTGFLPLTRQVSPGTTPEAWDLAMAPYQGPAVTNAPPAAASAASAAPGAAAPEASPAPAQVPGPELAAPDSGDLNRTAANALTVNGSVDNGAASPFAQLAAFGNARRATNSLYNGVFGLTFDNSALDARSFSLTGGPVPKPAYNNLTGLFQFGGPMIMPHVFTANNAPDIFVAYQKTANRTVADTPGLVPTVPERDGDLSAFSTPIINPATGQAFTDNQVPVSPQAKALLALYPLPNLTGEAGFNYEVPLVTALNQDSLQTRVSKGFNRGNQVSGNFALQSIRSGVPNLFGYSDANSTLGLNSNLIWRHAFSLYINGTLTYSYSRMRTRLTPYFAGLSNVSGNAGIGGNSQTPADWGPPTLNFSSGIASLTDGDPVNNRNQTNAISYATYWYHQNHNITFGGDFRRLEFDYLQQQDPRGAFTFNGDASGNDFADFLLGVPDTSSLSYGNADKYFRQSTEDLYFTDDWRALSSLTLNLGFRWEYQAPITELYGRMANLDVAPDFSSVAPVVASAPQGTVTGATYPSSLLRPDRRELEPRLALAWRPLAASSLIIRAGYGIYYDTSVYQNIALQMAQQAPYSVSLSAANSAANPLTLASGFHAPAGATADLFGVDPNFRIGYAQTWNASVQRDLPGSLVLNLGYLGTKGTRGVQSFYPNTYAPGGVNPCPACPVGFDYWESNGNSTYESGKAQLQRRFHNGLAANLQYTYAHAIDDSALGGRGQGVGVVAQNWLDLDAERGNSSFDQRHNLALTTQYSTGIGVHGGAQLRGWRGAAYKGWTVTTAVAAGSGLPLTPMTFTTVPGTGMTGVRPDLTGVSITAAPPGFFLNSAAYTAPLAGQWGTAGRDSITGPDQFSLNAGLQRSFQVGDRITASLRFDATNVLNHVVFPNWDTVYGSPQFGLPTSANPMRSLQTTLRFTY